MTLLVPGLSRVHDPCDEPSERAVAHSANHTEGDRTDGHHQQSSILYSWTHFSWLSWTPQQLSNHPGKYHPQEIQHDPDPAEAINLWSGECFFFFLDIINNQLFDAATSLAHSLLVSQLFTYTFGINNQQHVYLSLKITLRTMKRQFFTSKTTTPSFPHFQALVCYLL